jgi:hypothetical protein
MKNWSADNIVDSLHPHFTRDFNSPNMKLFGFDRLSQIHEKQRKMLLIRQLGTQMKNTL